MQPNETISGFLVEKSTALPEIHATLWQMNHVKSGARLAWLEREEENKTFGIAFRTIPSDDTGVFHILEHSVLCGSKRYPVKEFMTELMKSSMQTFLNAFTYPDKTVYPVSSRNHKDFMNLTRVYMDAALHPQVYDNPDIFLQEGWHYEMPKDGGAPTYKGVVFNEMKGAFSSPDTPLVNALFRQLFPDTSYRFESGGDPEHIPELTYQQFLDAHRTYYHPSNAYIVLDGRMDIRAVLDMLDGEYLSAFDRQESQPQFTRQAPVKGEMTQVYHEISPNEPVQERARLGWGCVLGDYASREEIAGMQILADVLCGGNQAPLKKKLLSQGLAQDLSIYVADGYLQPFVMLEAQNMDGGRAGEVDAAIREELERLVREGLDHAQLEAALANWEFQMRERDFGFPQGLGFGLTMLDSWLFGGDPAANLEVGSLCASLHSKLEEGWFEALLERVMLKNDHCCQVLSLPSATLGEEKHRREAERLEKAAAGWTDAQREELAAQQARLDAWQSAPDSPEALATLPTLELSDVPAQPEDIPLSVDRLGDAPLLRHAIPTGGVSYVNLYFDMSDVSQEQLSCAGFLCGLLGRLDAGRHDALELQRLSRLLLGDLRFSVDPCGPVNAPETCRTYLCASFSALESKVDEAAALVAEILTATRFDDSQKVRELLRQRAARVEESVPDSGNAFAVSRVSAGFSAQAVVQEHTGRIAFCQWLKALEKDFDGRAEALTAELEALQGRIFTTGRLTASVTGGEDACAAALERELLGRLRPEERRELPCAVRPWGRRREGIVIPAGISFAALGGDLAACGAPYNGTLLVAERPVSLSYLWNAIRVQGGAYGTGLRVNSDGTACFSSYRDPSAVRSLDCYRQAADFLARFSAEGPDLTNLIIGAVSQSDPLLMPKRRGKLSDLWYLKGITYADRCRLREEMLVVRPADLTALAESLGALTRQGGVCVIGSRQLVEACGQELDEIITL